LGTETSLSYDAGLYHKFGKTLDVRIASNYINTHNYFVSNTASSYYNGSYAFQISSMKYFGYEGEFNWAPFDKLSIFGNFSHLKNSYVSIEKIPVVELLELPPNNKGKVSIRYTLPAGFRLLSDITAIGRRGSEGGYTLDRYALLDFTVEKTIARKMKLGFFVNNLNGMDYQQVYGYPAPGRTFGVRLQVNQQTNLFTK
jgi:outer membrane receptor protein involved in Fe transport